MNLSSLLGPEPPANACRFVPGVSGHVESYFLRANDPVRPRALWLKATILAPRRGSPVAEAWAVFFDGETGRTFAHRETLPLGQASFSEPAGGQVSIRVADCEWTLGAEGAARGAMRRAGELARWDLSWTRRPSAVGEPLSLLPHRALRQGPFPKSKLATPFPALAFAGRLEVLGESVDLAGWQGMQGHNWGREHAFEYAWGQCLFPARDGAPEAMVEGFTGRVRVAGRSTPRLSALVVRRGPESFRFDRIFDFWRQEASLDGRRWELALSGPDGEARLVMDASDRPMVCLGYRNPDGALSYCRNSKLARVELRVRPARGAAFACVSEHGGALEFLGREPDPRLPEVV